MRARRRRDGQDAERGAGEAVTIEPKWMSEADLNGVRKQLERYPSDYVDGVALLAHILALTSALDLEKQYRDADRREAVQTFEKMANDTAAAVRQIGNDAVQILELRRAHVELERQVAVLERINNDQGLAIQELEQIVAEFEARSR
jgi:hypothetical protein